MQLNITFDPQKLEIIASDQSTADVLKNGSFGTPDGKELRLMPEEALFLMDVRNALCTDQKTGKQMSFNDLASKFSRNKKFMARYFTYKDWRDRGLIIKEPEFAEGSSNMVPIKKYPAHQTNLKGYKMEGIFFPDDTTTIADNPETSKIYTEHWIGQSGTYKIENHGSLNKLDIFETIFLMDKGVLSIKGYTKKQIMDIAVKMTARLREDVRRLRGLEVEGLRDEDRLQVRHPFQDIFPRREAL